MNKIACTLLTWMEGTAVVGYFYFLMSSLQILGVCIPLLYANDFAWMLSLRQHYFIQPDIYRQTTAARLRLVCLGIK